MQGPAIPPVLLNPPWRAASTAHEHGPTAPASLPPPRLRWSPAERELFAGPQPKSLDATADERLRERLLDKLDRRVPLSCQDVQRLSDDGLRELCEEVEADTIDSATLQLLLARVGEPFVARAVDLVLRSAPERGLMAAMGPVEAPALAPFAAARLAARRHAIESSMARRFSPNPDESWLERHAEAASAALAGAAADPDSNAHECACIALRWLAIRRATKTGRADLDAELAPFRSLAPLAAIEELSWLPIVVALDMDRLAISMLDAHPSPDAVHWIARATKGKARDAAIGWLEKNRDLALETLAGLGTDDARGALAILEGDSAAGDPALLDLPAAIPPLPPWLEIDILPPPCLRDGTALPPDAVHALTEMLRFTSLARPYAGVKQVLNACDGNSLDAFAVALLQAWTAQGQAPRDRWMLDASGAIGGDKCAGEVASAVRGWARAAQLPQRGWDEEERRVVTWEEGDRNWNYALTGCEVLRAIRTELALTALDDLAHNAPQAWLRRHAKHSLGDLLDNRGPRVRIDDTRVPDLGLDNAGSMSLDLGGRMCRVAFDERLAPILVDDDGNQLKAFPRARKSDDEKRYAEAKATFNALRRDTTVIARQQIGQLERAMNHQHAWSADAFAERFVRHPLLRHLAHRLIWRVVDSGLLLRIAEDGSLAGEADDEVALARSAKVTVAHPATMGAANLANWIRILDDYKLLQPFEQLHREVYALQPEDRGERQLPRFADQATSGGRLFGIKHRGWTTRDGAAWSCELPGGAEGWVRVSPPFEKGSPAEGEHIITEAWCTKKLNRLPPIDYSELLRDLAYLTRADPHATS